MKDSLIILDRDGVLNKLLVRQDGTTDSPMTIDEIEIFPGVQEQLSILCNLGYDIVIATNQPAAAKGKTSIENLKKIHSEIINRINNNILDSFICFHRNEDYCNCRKPKVGLLEAAFNKYNFIKSKSWMIGDRATDIMAGCKFGLNTILIGPSIKSDIQLLKEENISPLFICKDLTGCVKSIISYNK